MAGLASTVWNAKATEAVASSPSDPVHHGFWDAGDMGCGELVIDLRSILRAAPGKILKLVARDPGAPADIPAYCRMTGHRLLHESPEQAAFWIQAKT